MVMIIEMSEVEERKKFWRVEANFMAVLRTG